MEKLIKNFFGEAETQKAQADLDLGISTFKSFATSLNNTQRRGLCTMAEGREGVARTISRVSLTHGDCLPRNEDPGELEQALAYYDRLAGLLQKAALYNEMIDDTLTALGTDIMALSGRYAEYLQAARSGNNSLDMALDQLDQFNKRFAKKNPVRKAIPESPIS